MRIQTDAGVFFIYWRYDDYDGEGPWKKETSCYIIDDKSKPVTCGISYCSKKDNFCKDKGRKTSLAKAIGQFRKSLRKEIWEGYLNRKVKNGSNN